MSAKSKIRGLLKQRVGQIITGSEIQDAVGPMVAEWARRLRELRREEGWKISSSDNRADLKPGEFVLESPPEHGYKFSNSIPMEVLGHVMGKVWFCCQMCGIGAGHADQHGSIATLHISHIVDKGRGGKDELSNLRVLCGPCKNGVKYLPGEPPVWPWLDDLVRQVDQSDWSATLKWLDEKYQKVQRTPSGAWLLEQVERASWEDQLAMLKWLTRKFPAAL